MLFSDSSWTLVFWYKDPCNKTNGALKKNRRLLKKERTNQLWPLCAVSFSGVRSSAILPSGIIWYYLVSSGIIWYHLILFGITWYHLSIVWCLGMVDSCCPSNVKSVKKFCEYRISEILRFSLFDILIFCKNSSNCFLLLCKKVQQTNIMTSLYPLTPSAPSSDWATSGKTNPQQAQSYSERVCDGWPWMWSDDRMHWTRISSSLTLKA